MTGLGTKTIETGDEIVVEYHMLSDGRGPTEELTGYFVGVCMDLTSGSDPLLLVDEGNDCPESVGFNSAVRVEAVR